jgi:hypothetical protein
VGTRRVRALLDSDRRAANEVRPEFEEIRLRTAPYVVPLRLRLKRSFREDERVRVGSLILGASLLVVLLSSLMTSLGTARASHDAARPPQLAMPETTLVRSSMLALSHQPRALAAAEQAAALQGVRDRLQHARRVLAMQDEEAAGRARDLLEQLVRDRPEDGRVYATLAEACLRLADAHCAREAVANAMARQPRRAKYRALAASIERTFAERRE